MIDWFWAKTAGAELIVSLVIQISVIVCYFFCLVLDGKKTSGYVWDFKHTSHHTVSFMNTQSCTKRSIDIKSAYVSHSTKTKDDCKQKTELTHTYYRKNHTVMWKNAATWTWKNKQCGTETPKVISAEMISQMSCRLQDCILNLQ